MKGLLHDEDGGIELELAEVVSGEYSVPRSGYYYQVFLKNEVFAASPSLVKDDFNLASGEQQSMNEGLKETVYLSVGPANEPIMAVRHDFVINDLPATVYAAQSLEESMSVVRSFKNVLLIAVPSTIGILSLIGLWITGKAMKPLERFSSAIEKITHRTMNERLSPELHAAEVKNIAASFNAMLERLQTAFETEKRLIADASHELKTPLSVIKAQCDVLQQQEKTPAGYTNALSRIKTASERMNRLIGDMLSLTRLDSGFFSTAEFSVIDLNDCIENALKFTEFAANERQVKIIKQVPEDIRITGDRDLLIEVFMNIIEDAIKYNRAGGSVEISALRNNEKAEVFIRDTGRGIKEEDIGKIFDRFYRAGISRSIEGTGLGLSIVKAIIQVHNGKIEVTSEADKGSCFMVNLPMINI